MPTNHYFQGGDGIGSAAEKRLMENLIIEGLKIYGHDVYYLPRTLVNKDLILGEDVASKFNAAYHIYKSDYVRTYLFKRSINTWVSEIKIDGKTMENNISAEKGLINYWESGGKYFIEKAESILGMYSNTFLISKKLILLDSIRMLCKKISPNKLGLINLKLDLI